MAVQTRAHVLTLGRENQDQIRAFGVQRLGLFGSFVRGEQGEESDKVPILQREVDRIIRAENQGRENGG
jgi:predicted nucleotidyltransferase